MAELVNALTRRTEILAAAAELFARHGYDGVSIGDIGRAVGLTGPVLYRHFRGKDAVLAEILLDISDRLLTEGSARVVAAADPLAALDALLRWHIAFSLDNPVLIIVHERELDNVPEPQRRRSAGCSGPTSSNGSRCCARSTPGLRRTGPVLLSTPCSGCSTRPRTARASHGRTAARDGGGCPRRSLIKTITDR